MLEAELGNKDLFSDQVFVKGLLRLVVRMRCWEVLERLIDKMGTSEAIRSNLDELADVEKDLHAELAAIQRIRQVLK